MHNDPIQKLTEEIKQGLLDKAQTQTALDQTKASDAEKVGTFDVIISTGDKDRHGERIDPDGMDVEHFRANPVVLFAHAHFNLPIGRAEEVGVEMHEGKKVVRAKGKFAPADANPEAQQVRKLHDIGILNTTSVGVIVHEIKIGDEDEEKTLDREKLKEIGALTKGENGETISREVLKEKGILTKDDMEITLTKTELLEFSFVPVPANPFATAIRENGLDMAELATKGLILKAEEGADKPQETETTEAEPAPETAPEAPQGAGEGATGDPETASDEQEETTETDDDTKGKEKQDPDSADAPEAVKKIGALFSDLGERINDEVVQTNRKALKIVSNALEGNDKADDGGETINKDTDPEPETGEGGENNDNNGASPGETGGGGEGEDASEENGGSPKERSMRAGTDGMEDAKTYFQVRDVLRAVNTATSEALQKINKSNPRRGK